MIYVFTRKIYRDPLKLEDAVFEYAREHYNDFIDNVYEPIKIGGSTILASEALEKCDPIAYRVGVGDYENILYEDFVEEFKDLIELKETYEARKELLPDEEDQNIM